MAKKKQKTVFSYKEYKENNGTTVSFGDYKKQQEQERKIRQQQESMAAVKEKMRKQRLEQKKREESQARTKAWQEAYNDAKNAGGEDKSWQVYAAKMISDTPGALEKEQERERKRQEEIARKNRIALQSNYGTPTKGPALKNELTEKFGPYRTQQNALNSYIGALKESKAAKEKSYPTLSGQKPQGPIDKQETVFSRFLTNLNKKQQERNQSIQGGREGYKAATGMITNNGQKQFGVRTFKDFAQLMQRRGAKGELNNSGIPLFMNKEGRAAYREAAEQKQTKADTMRSDFVKNRDAWSPEQKWESVFDMLEDRAEKNEERILRGRYTPEQQAVAGRTLSNLQGTRESRKQDVMDRAKDFFQFQYKKEDWENIDDENPDFMSSQDRRELLYDQIMPDTYAERTARMTAEEKAQLDSLIDAVFEDAAGTELDWFKKEDEYKRLIRESNSELQEADKVEQYQRDYDYFTNWANEYGTEGSPFKGGPLDGSYDPSLVQTQETMKGGKYSVKITEPTGSRTDKAYYYMNNVPELGAYGNVSGTEQKEYFATPEMVDTFNKLYKYDREKGSNMAEQFLDGIDYYLTSCMNLYHEYDVRRLSEDPVFGITARAGSFIANAAMAPVNLINTGLAMLGNKDAADPNNTINQINRDIQTLRENQNEVADEAIAQLIPFMKGKTNFLLNVGDSIIDNVVAMGAAKMLAPGMTSNEASQKLGMRLVQLIMSGEATGHTFVQKLDQGMDAGEAAIYAIGDGIIEWFTERVSLEALLKPDVRAMLGNQKELLKFIGKTTLAEGSEEVAADLLNWGLDYIMSMAYEHKTELESRRDELIASGMDKDEAWRQALTEKFEQIGLSGLAGGISGGVMGIGRIGMNAVNQIRTGSMTKNTQVNGLTGTEGLLEIAKEMNGEMSVKQAEAIQQKIDNGQEVSSKELGKLAQTIQMETSEKLNNPGGVTIDEYITGMDTLKSVAEYTGQVKAEENRTSSIWAKPDEISELEQKGKAHIQGNREAIWYDEKTGDGRFVKIDNVKTVQDKDDGNKWKLKLTVTVDGKQQDVNATDLKMTDYKTAKILYMASTKPEYFSGEFTQTLLDAAEKGQFSDDNRMMDRQLRDAQLIRLYAYAGQETDSLKLASLDRDTQNRIWLQSADEHRQNRQQQVKDAGAQRSSRITYRGAEYGTKAWNDVVKEMPKNMRAQMDVIAAVAQKAGVSVDFEDLSDEKLYGWENKNDKKIGINVNGINFDTITGERSGRHHMLVTFGHEFTHWMMQHSMAGYNRLEQYVLKSYMKERGAVGLQNVIESYRMGEDHLNLEDAIAEIVAEASDSVLMDENVVRHIQESDNKLYTEIKKFATDLVGRLKEAIGLMPDSQSSIRRVLANYANEINRLWTGAFDEALSGYITDDNGKQLTPAEYRQMVAEETGTTAENISRMSRAELNDAYMDAVENGTEQQQMMFVNEAAERGGYDTEYAYHGTPFFGFTLFDMGRSMNSIFVTYSRELAQIYADNAQVKQISQRAIGNIDSMTDEQLLDVARKYITERAGEKVNSIELNKGKFRISYYDSLDQRNRTMEWDRRTFSQMVQNAVKKTGAMNGVYQLYTRPGRQFVVDAKQAKSNDIKLDGQIAQDMGTDTFNTRMIAKWARENGYDSVRIKNVTGNQGIVTDYGVFFNAQDVKSADPVTYDENGKVITVSERFKDQKTDIRWSRAQLDKEYMAAVNMGRYDLAEKMVDEAAKEAGYTIKAYHGTPNGKFTVFDRSKVGTSTDFGKLGRGFYFSSKKQVADYYAGYLNSSTVMPVYLKLNNPFVLDRNYDNMTVREMYDSILGKGGIVDEQRSEELTKWLIDNGYDGIIADGEYMVLDPNNIKSAESVTYDNYGDVIPLSERFNDEKTDIRWSRANSVDENYTPELMAVHNLTYYDLLRTLKEGGFTAPSIAIIKSAMGHDKYGEISVLFKKNAFDPKTNRLNKIYGADAYTPTRANAHVETELIREELNKAADEIAALVEGMEDNHAYNEIQRWFSERNYKEVTTQTAREMAEEAYSNDAFLAAYLKEQGKEIPIKTKERYANPDIKEDRLEGYERIFNAIYNSGRFEEFWNDVENHDSGETMMEKWADIAAAAEPQMKRVLDLYREKGGKLARNATYNWIKQTIDWLRGGSEKVTETDWYETRKAMWDMVDKETFTEWLAKKIEPAFGRKGIRNNEDPFTPIGNRRTWNQLHKPYSIENIVKAMYENADEKAQGGRYATGVVAAASKEYKSLDEIREDRERLRLESEEDYSKIISDLDERLKDLAYNIWPTSHAVFDFAMIEVAKKYAKNQTEAAIRSGFRAEDIRVTQEQVEQVKAFLDDARNIPTGYFEAKPQRVMNFDEIDTVILPENTYGELLDLLDQYNIHYEFYDGSSADRTAKLNEHKDLKFSRWTENAMDVNLWMKGATASTVMTEDERELLKAYNGMRVSIDLSLKKQMDYKAKIRQLEGKTDLTKEQKDELTATRNRLEIEEAKYARLEDEMVRITTGEGFAAVMYRENMKLKDYIQGKTQDQVKQAIDDMLKLVEQTQAQITKDTEELRKLATHQAVQTMKSFMGKTSLSRMASILRKTYNSTMNKAEIEDRLAEMALKKASGQDITADTETLAQDLLDKMRGVRTDALESLRGQTLVIGQSLADELKAENSSIKELQSRIKGSGVKIVTGVRSNATDANGRQIVDKHSRISEQWKELRERNAALPDVENMAEIDKLHTIIDFIEGELRASTGAEQFNVDFDEVAAMVRASVGNVTTYLVDDPNARAQINNLMKQIADLSKATQRTAEDMQNLYRQMDDVAFAGQKAKGWATVLQRDVSDAIKYYNTTARLAAEKERTKVRKALIEQLRSENAQKLVQQAEKFREQMANDKKARELAADNAALRKQISTVSMRMANRIFAETDRENVPEETKALVRQVLDMISKHDAYNENEEGFLRKVTLWDKQEVDNVRLRLMKMIAHYGQFDPDTDLDWLVVKAENPADNDYTAQEKVIQDLIDIETGLMEYRNAEGHGRISLADRKAALEKVQEALSEIWNVVKARSEMEIAGRKWQVIEMAEWMRDEMGRSRFKGERTGFGSRARDTISGGVTWGNLTPEYFFKNLKNKAMDMLHKGLKIAEDRSGLEAAKAKVRLAEIAQANGFNTWDGQEEHQVRVSGGKTITMTTEQIMALYATWLREKNQMRPDDTAHLLNGGFVLAKKENKTGLPGREKQDTRPIRMSEGQLEAMGGMLTKEQKQYVDDMVAYMSSELAELGNEASMKMYGIKKFTEEYYFPIKSWGGVLNKRSDAGISSSNENRAAQQGFSKRIKNNASNAIEIGDFTPTAIKHVAGMITYNTVGPAIENLNKVLNQQLVYGEIKYTEDGQVDEDDTYKQNIRAAFTNAYGKQAGDYLAKFMKDMNGGVTTERTAFDKLLSLFKKNAVAGSLSVAAQQPLSYIRAAMMINPKYLAQAISPQYWKGSYAEMMKHSGVAVIKEMGKFDMNYGQTMQEWITPEGMESKARKAWNKTTDLVTGLPGAMDMMTWTRMWTAVKLEQMAENKGMDYQSDEFMAKVAERFNDLMRQTQVYDSVMTKSQNMRSTHFYAKTLTSFMAEPTLSLNVLADAFQNMKEKGGKAKAIKAVATFLLSAAAQAGAKAFFGAGRTPDKKKNRKENFYNKFLYNLLSEANPFGLIPGYRQIIETLTDGEFKDDTMGMIAKAGDVVDRIWKLATGEIGQKGLYRDMEDSIGQALQLMTDIPAKNMMRDFRAMVNWFSGGTASGFTGDTYAQRETSAAVLKYQLIDNLMSNDIMGLVNKKLDDAGYKTTNAAYYQRIVDAEKAGNQDAAKQMKEYLILKSDAADPEKAVNDAIRKLYKKDEDLSAEERLAKQKEYGLVKGGSYILGEYEAGNLTRKEAEKLYREENPKKTDKEVLAAFDKIDYEKKTGKEIDSYSNYMPLYDAISNNKSDEIKAAAKYMMDNGYKAEDIKKQLSDKYRQAYLDAKGSEKTKLMDALTKAYKAIGLTADEAMKIINGWKPKKETKKK